MMSRSRLLWYVLASLLAVATYFYALDSQYIPKNGDEYPYEHITRLTAASGHWLPLQSELDHMRNTKPPLLFWQGIASTYGGQAWTLWNLRYPSVIYTLLTALLVFLLARKLAAQGRPDPGIGVTEVGFTAALAYLAFFSTYRFGRPFLVNPAETFWFFLPFFALLYWQTQAFVSRWLPVPFGLALGIGLLYKSFALLAPLGVVLAWWYLARRDYRWGRFLRDDLWKVALAGVVALGVFALWFVFDPDPQSVWHEFVVGENAGKFGAHDGYLKTLLWGGSSVWAMLLGYPMNAGLLAFPVLALAFVAWRERHKLGAGERLLWIWMLVLFVVFCVPSQRSARYLLDAMPGLAVICALHWQRIPRGFFLASLGFAAAVLGLLGFLAQRLQAEVGGLYGPMFWALLAVGGATVLAGLLVSRYTRITLSVAALLVMLSLAAFTRPFDGPQGRFDQSALQQVQGKDVWVPCNFRAVDEGYRFLLPGANVHGYYAEPRPALPELSSRYGYFITALPLGETCADCTALGQRLVIRGRHDTDEIRRMLHGEVYAHLFEREWLVASNHAVPATAPEAGCR